ncbi:MAG: hypothetical protein ACFFC7_04380 [Candidatus Hermodarchaeota archaeon]
MAESLNHHLLYQILQTCPTSYMNIEQFNQIFWQKKRATKTTFSVVDLQLLKAIFSNVETESCIGFPSIPELWQDDWHFSERTARARYRRLQDLAILTRNPILNHGKLGLIPFLKIYDRGDELSEVEKQFCTWENSLPSDKILRYLTIPEYSWFWFESSSQIGHRIQLRGDGLRIDAFNGTKWELDKLDHEVNEATHHEIDYTGHSFKFRYSDLHLLYNLKISSSRQVKYVIEETDYSQGFVSRRFKELKEAGVFEPVFILWNAGLNERYYLFVEDTEKNLLLIEHLVRRLPRYTFLKANNCIFALVWLSSELVPIFLDRCSDLRKNLSLLYGRVIQHNPSYMLNLPLLRDEKENLWLSEYE